MKNLTLTRTECSAMRAVAILGIVLHNYTHWLRLAVKENEYTFTQANADGLWNALLTGDSYLFIHLLSFFGHYGVPVFLFLSGYGPVMKYEQPRQGGAAEAGRWLSDWHFIRVHFLKLFKMMIVGFVAFTMVDAITPQRHHYHFMDVVGQLGMFNNLMEEPHHIIWPGPYWFFGLMMQLYLLYRLVFFRWRGVSIVVAAILLCWAVQAVCDPTGDSLNYLRYNFVGGVLPFGAGLLYARGVKSGKNRQWGTGAVWAALLAGVVLTVLFSMNYQSWFWVPLLIIGATIAVVKLLPDWLMRPADWLGGVSAALFVAHPITRKIFIPLSHHGDVYTGLLLYVVASVCLAWLFRLLMRQIPDPR